MQKKYLVNNFLGLWILRTIDVALFFLPKRQKTPQKFQKILLSNIAHLGDVVIATSILPIIKKQFPKSEIGFICGSWSLPIIKGHELINNIYVVDHWKLNRTNKSRWQKVRQYLSTKRKALCEIRKEQYDVAIDLYPYFPNTIFLLWQANIGMRVGYNSGGFGPLLTHSYNLENSCQHMSIYNINLLKALSIKWVKKEPLLPSLPKIKDNDQYFAKPLTQNTAPLPTEATAGFRLKEGYLLFHVGTDGIIKEWDIDKWQKLTQKFNKEGYSIVFTGRGARENRNIEQIIGSTSNCYNLCDKLNWHEFVLTIAKAQILISIDSVAVHIAAAFKVKTVVLFCGINDAKQWINQGVVITKKLPCVPCNKKEGCNTMECLKGISVDEVFTKINDLCLSHKVGDKTSFKSSRKGLPLLQENPIENKI
jgi:ADP-heptose:LPS heptosyltransferase